MPWEYLERAPGNTDPPRMRVRIPVVAAVERIRTQAEFGLEIVSPRAEGNVLVVPALAV